MRKQTIEKDIEELDELLDGMSGKIKKNAHAWTAINDMQLSLYELKRALEENID